MLTSINYRAIVAPHAIRELVCYVIPGWASGSPNLPYLELVELTDIGLQQQSFRAPVLEKLGGVHSRAIILNVSLTTSMPRSQLGIMSGERRQPFADWFAFPPCFVA